MVFYPQGKHKRMLKDGQESNNGNLGLGGQWPLTSTWRARGLD